MSSTVGETSSYKSDRRGRSKGRGGHRGHHSHRNEFDNLPSGSIESLPILRMNSDRTTVGSEHAFRNFSVSLENYARREFGDIADIFRTHKYPDYPPIKFNKNELTPGKDPHGLALAALKRRITNREDKSRSSTKTRQVIRANKWTTLVRITGEDIWHSRLGYR